MYLIITRNINEMTENSDNLQYKGRIRTVYDAHTT